MHLEEESSTRPSISDGGRDTIVPTTQHEPDLGIPPSIPAPNDPFGKIPTEDEAHVKNIITSANATLDYDMITKYLGSEQSRIHNSLADAFESACNALNQVGSVLILAHERQEKHAISAVLFALKELQQAELEGGSLNFPKGRNNCKCRYPPDTCA
jgi:hypothetical protein